MNRREALRNFILAGGAISIVSPLGLLSQACNPVSKRSEGLLSNGDSEKIVTEIADTIIPPTDTPGAKAAGVGPFIVMMIHDCYPKDIQKIFMDGINEVEKKAVDDFDKSFTNIHPTERKALLKKFEEETDEQRKKFFQLVRELTFLGYFTSEIGATQALNYVQIPGKYDGCVPLKKKQKAWAT
jgi:hypothetical protein